VTNERVEERDEAAITDLLTDLANLRELDRRRAVLTPGSEAYDAATSAVDVLSAQVMNRFRDAHLRPNLEVTNAHR
jgi:hypothetical protein